MLLDARQEILRLMKKEISKPRQSKKSNQPILKNYPVSVVQRSKLIGVGGMNLKKIYAKTGVTVNPVDETNFSIFAPNQDALNEAEEMIKAFIEQQVSWKKRFKLEMIQITKFKNI